MSSVLAALAGPLSAAPAFVSAEDCGLCHSRSGVLTRAPVGHFESWRSSMMSAAARDPYWRSRVAVESNAPGADAAKVQDKCLRCHAAADQYAFRQKNLPMRLSDVTDLGREGVTCTVCHRIEATNLGTPTSFTGGFRISADNFLFGPHERPFAMPMLHHTGYEPVHAKHVLDAALCGSCHTLLLADASGRVSLPEQTTFLEWLASDYPKRKTTCQTCHVPVAKTSDGHPARDYIAHRPPGGAFPPTRPRSPIGVHTFLGGNVQMLLFLAAGADGDGFRERAEATRRFLSSALALDSTAEVKDGLLLVNVTVRNLTGHKLPTGLPGRRLWLHVKALDSDNRVVFESGAWDPASGDLLNARGFEPHRDVIARSDQTAVYEALTEDSSGKLTNLLTQAARFRKDNRLLPAGFGTAAAMPDGVKSEWIAPVGTTRDATFQPGQDTVSYRVRLSKGASPERVSVEACFQSIRPADAAPVAGLHRGPEVIATTEAAVKR